MPTPATLSLALAFEPLRNDPLAVPTLRPVTQWDLDRRDDLLRLAQFE